MMTSSFSALSKGAGKANRMELLDNYLGHCNDGSTARESGTEVIDLTYLEIQSNCARVDNDDRMINDPIVVDSCSVHIGLNKENAVQDASNESNKINASQELVSLPAGSKKEQEAEESSAAFEDVSLADDDIKQETEKTQEKKARSPWSMRFVASVTTSETEKTQEKKAHRAWSTHFATSVPTSETEKTQEKKGHRPWSTRFVASVPTSDSNKQETNFENLSKVSGLKTFGEQQLAPDSRAVQDQSLEDIMAKTSLRGLGRLFGDQQHHQVGDTESGSSSDADEDESLKVTTKSDPITVRREASNATEGRVGRWGNAFRNYYAGEPHVAPIGKDMDQSNDDDHTDGDSESTTSHYSSCTLESVDPSEFLEENGGGPNVTANRPWTRLWRAQEFTSDSSPTVHFI